MLCGNIPEKPVWALFTKTSFCHKIVCLFFTYIQYVSHVIEYKYPSICGYNFGFCFQTELPTLLSQKCRDVSKKP